MATLIPHVKPWMQKSIVDSEAGMEQRMATMMDQKVQAVHNRLDAFELRVLERPASATDLAHFRTELDRLQDDLHAIMVTPTDQRESAHDVLAYDTFLGALFNEDTTHPEPTRAQGKRHRSSHMADTTKDARAKKQERQQHEQARKASIVDESIAGASSSAPVVEVPTIVRDDVTTTDVAVRVTDNNTEGAVIDDVGTTKGEPSVLPAGSGKPDTPACS
uniref:Integrase core domain containing protein n=1 Tax=Solanum tuberosum TaxID=4113 RepID=M1E123_SOLTU